MRAIPVKTARLEARIAPDLLGLLRRAAQAQGRSVSDYVAATLQAAAQRDVGEAEIVRLSLEASEAFAVALIDPPPLSPAMQRAFEHHRRLVRTE